MVSSPEGDLEQLRLMTRVARLYHEDGVRQRDIADRLGLSQPRVSRLLQSAQKAGIVRTTVVTPPGLYTDLEAQLARVHGLADAHVVGAESGDEDQLHRHLGTAAASYVEALLPEAGTIAFGSWSRPLQAMVEALRISRPVGAGPVVEVLGDLGSPAIQHQVAGATQRLADQIGAEPVFLRTPGVMTSARVRAELLETDAYARHALELLDDVRLAVVGIGPVDVSRSLLAREGSIFNAEQAAELRRLDAVGNVNLRFYDAAGEAVGGSLDELVVGMSLEQLRRSHRVVGIAGGDSKRAAILGALRGRLVHVLVTDVRTAQHLVSAA